MQKINTLCFFILFIIYSCQPKVEKKTQSKPEIHNRFKDSIFVKIYDFQDKRDTKSLLAYLTNEKPEYREAAALAFASIQDTSVIPHLNPLLLDRQYKVRLAAAYSLGQIAHPKALEGLFSQFANDNNVQVGFTILEAIGKCAVKETPKKLSELRINEDTLKVGLAYGLYRAGLKGFFSEEATKKIFILLDDKSTKVRRTASFYLGRFRQPDYKPYEEQLLELIGNENNALVKMNVSLALGQLKSKKALQKLEEVYSKDNNYLVKINILRACNNFDYPDFKKVLWDALENENPSIAQSAVNYLGKKIPETDFDKIQEITKKTQNWQLRTSLFSLLMEKDSLRIPLSIEIKKLYQQSKNPYEKGELLKSLVTKSEEYWWINYQLKNEKHAYIQSSAIEALIKIRESEQWDNLVKNLPRAEKDLADILKSAIESRDVGLVYFASQALRNPKSKFKEYFKKFDFLEKSLKEIILPRDIEAYIELKKTLDYFQDNQPDENFPKSIENPIDWSEVAQIDQSQQVLIQTNKGKIILNLKVNDAPGSVATYVKLVKSGFYDQRTFHRVVPNFVIQGGCPRGDGFGGLDYTIRSEFNLNYYAEGSVGLASAGKDTESCQFFITHSPTPHLDGRYTIFAEVAEGMDVVHQIQIGDIIEKITLIPLTNKVLSKQL